MTTKTRFVKNLVIPFYCPRCGKYCFLYHLLDKNKIGIINSLEPPWEEHSCFQFGGEEIRNNSYFEKLQQIPWGEERIPFKRRKKGKNKVQKKHYSGVILSIELEEAGVYLLRAIDDVEDVLEINYTGALDGLCAGMLVDLRKIVSLQTGRFRLQSIDQIVIEKEFTVPEKTPAEYYELKIWGKDQEQLETYMNRFVAQVKKDRGRLLAVVPLPLEEMEGEKRFTRKMIFLGQAGLIQILQGFSFPKGIDMQFSQQKSR